MMQIPFWKIEKLVEDDVVRPLIRDPRTPEAVRAAAYRVQEQVNKENRAALAAALIALERLQVFDAEIRRGILEARGMVAGNNEDVVPIVARPGQPARDATTTAA